MICANCKQDKFCVPFKSYNNVSGKSFMLEKWLCIICVERGGWKVDQEWRNKGRF